MTTTRDQDLCTGKLNENKRYKDIYSFTGSWLGSFKVSGAGVGIFPLNFVVLFAQMQFS